MVPAAAIEKGDFEANVGFEKLRNFLEAFSETAWRILRAIFGLVGVRIDFLELVDGLEGFLAHAAESLIDRLRVHGFETAFDGLLRAVKLELIQIGDGNGGRAALKACAADTVRRRRRGMERRGLPAQLAARDSASHLRWISRRACPIP